MKEHLAALSRLRGPPPADAAPALRKALADRVNLVAAKAANIAADLPAPEILPDLLRAFDRLFEDPVKRDPQCWGKNAIARAMAFLPQHCGSRLTGSSKRRSKARSRSGRISGAGRSAAMLAALAATRLTRSASALRRDRKSTRLNSSHLGI